MERVSRVRMTGPLAAYRDGLYAELLVRGYAPLSACQLMRVTGHLSRWLEEERSAVRALKRYAAARDRRFRGRSTSPALFISLGGTRLVYKYVHLTFFRLVDQAGLANRKPRRPRIHDLRHTFAVRTLIGFYLAGLDVERQLPVRSTYLGHVHPSDTYWYLSAVPELLDVAAKRLEETMGELP